MKLTPVQIEQALSQFEFQHVPEEGQLAPQLNTMFGDHTFFLGNAGLHIVHSGEPDEAGQTVGRVVKLASWTDERRTALAPHKPELTDVVIDLDEAA